MPSPMNLIKKNNKKVKDFDLNEKNEKEEKNDDLEDLNLREINLCNSDEEHDPSLFQLKMDDSEKRQSKRNTIRMDSKLIFEDNSSISDKNKSSNDVLKYKITLNKETLYHLKNNNTIINFMKNSSDKNISKLYKELSEIEN